MLAAQRSFEEREKQYLSRLLDTIDRVVRLDVGHGRVTQGNQKEDLLRGLREDVESLTQEPACVSAEPDSGTFSATILIANERDTKEVVCRSKIDSGCEDNWISADVLARAKLVDKVVEIKKKKAFTHFSGHHVVPTGMVDITWYASNTAMSRRTTFLVHPTVPFDLVLGRLLSNDDPMFSKLVLGLLGKKHTKGRYVYTIGSNLILTIYRRGETTYYGYQHYQKAAKGCGEGRR